MLSWLIVQTPSRRREALTWKRPRSRAPAAKAATVSRSPARRGQPLPRRRQNRRQARASVPAPRARSFSRRGSCWRGSCPTAARCPISRPGRCSRPARSLPPQIPAQLRPEIRNTSRTAATQKPTVRCSDFHRPRPRAERSGTGDRAAPLPVARPPEVKAGHDQDHAEARPRSRSTGRRASRSAGCRGCRWRRRTRPRAPVRQASTTSAV